VRNATSKTLDDDAPIADALDRGRPIDGPDAAESIQRRLVVACLALGLVLRFVRWLVNYPLWHDEAFVSVNILERGYLDFVGQRLNYGQVCPLLFLWAERAAVQLFGPSEWALRLVPLACALASMALFAHLAARLLGGTARVLAVAIFAVSYAPIRHAAEVKPYAGDALAATWLLVAAVEWLRAPERARWLAILATSAPLVLGLSYPAVFVAAAVGLALLQPASRTRRRVIRLAFLAYGISVTLGFGVSYAACGAAQAAAVRDGYRHGYWADAFPPAGPGLVPWLARMHTGCMLAYPVGGENGGSLATALAVAAAVAYLWRRRERTVVALLVGPMAVGLLAAALGRYPYGTEARLSQYLAPGLCILAGLGANLGLAWLGRLRLAHGRRARAALVLTLIGLGATLLARDVVRPYRDAHDVRARRFARWFWRNHAREAELACARTDLGLISDPRHWDIGLTATYLTYQRLFSERHRTGAPCPLGRVSSRRPLNLVLFNEEPETSRAVARWLERQKPNLRPARRYRYVLDSGQRAAWHRAVYVVLELVPTEDTLAWASGAEDPRLSTPE
jgi:hypothetical protein